MRNRLTPLLAAAVALLMATPVLASHRFPERINLPNGWQPEGITTGRGGTTYVGSLADGAIWKADVKTGEGSILVPGASGNVAVGVDYEARRHRLWVAGGPTGAVRVYDARSGELLETYQFQAGFLNDLVVTREAVYVTDSFIQQLDVIPLGRHGRLPEPDEVETLPLHGDIAFGPEFNANGIVAARGFLIVVQSNTGKLFRVNPDHGRARAIDLGGYSVSFGDGLELDGRTLYVVRNFLNRVAVLRLGKGLLKARLQTELTSPDLDVPATATLARGHLWAVNARFSTPPTSTTDYWITRLPRRP